MKSATPIYNEQIASLPFYVTRTATDYIENGIVRENGFDEYQIMQCTKGKGEFICQEKIYEINELDIVIFSPAIPHQYHRHKKSSTPWKVDWVCFLVNEANHITKQLVEQGHCVIKAVDATNLSSQFNSIVSILQTDSNYHQMQASVILYGIIAEIVAIKQGLLIPSKGDPFLEPVISYMKQNLDKPITIEECSELVGVSVSYLCRKFKEVYQISPIKHLINLRMVKARELLISSNKMTVKNISSQCGYSDVSYFCSEFKRYFRLSPAEYQKRFSS